MSNQSFGGLAKLIETVERLRSENAQLRAECGELREQNQRLVKRGGVLLEAKRAIERRYLPCPDHRDKHQTGDECLMCQLERALSQQKAVSKSQQRRLRIQRAEREDGECG